MKAAKLASSAHRPKGQEEYQQFLTSDAFPVSSSSSAVFSFKCFNFNSNIMETQPLPLVCKLAAGAVQLAASKRRVEELFQELSVVKHKLSIMEETSRSYFSETQTLAGDKANAEAMAEKFSSELVEAGSKVTNKLTNKSTQRSRHDPRVFGENFSSPTNVSKSDTWKLVAKLLTNLQTKAPNEADMTPEFSVKTSVALRMLASPIQTRCDPGPRRLVFSAVQKHLGPPTLNQIQGHLTNIKMQSKLYTSLNQTGSKNCLPTLHISRWSVKQQSLPLIT